MMEVHVAQLVPPLRLVRGLVRGLLPGQEILDQRGGGRILRAHLGEDQRLVARAQSVAAGPRALQPTAGRPGDAVHPAALARPRPASAKVESRSSARRKRTTATAYSPRRCAARPSR